jgi:hypothetical protein
MWCCEYYFPLPIRHFDTLASEHNMGGGRGYVGTNTPSRAKSGFLGPNLQDLDTSFRGVSDFVVVVVVGQLE